MREGYPTYADRSQQDQWLETVSAQAIIVGNGAIILRP